VTCLVEIYLKIQVINGQICGYSKLLTLKFEASFVCRPISSPGTH